MSNYTAGVNETCHLAPHARALSALITAAASSVISSATIGFENLFFTTCACWLGGRSPRILITGVWFIYEAFQSHRAEGGEQFTKFYQKVPGIRFFVSK
jgi:hypothetical protein